MDRLDEIFKMQASLLNRFHMIEQNNGFRIQSGIPVDLDLPSDQHRIREFAGRFTEELAGETVESLNRRKGLRDLQEEAIDALHFLAELSILVGYDPLKHQRNQSHEHEPNLDSLEGLYAKAFPEYYKPGDSYDRLHFHRRVPISKTKLHEIMLEPVHHLWMACNFLKNKPWKQSIKTTDQAAFFNRLDKTWTTFIKLLGNLDLSPEATFAAYMGKHKTNEDRIAQGV